MYKAQDELSCKFVGFVLYSTCNATEMSISQLEKLLHKCGNELYWLDMSINFKKSCIGPRCDIDCCAITTLTGVN